MVLRLRQHKIGYTADGLDTGRRPHNFHTAPVFENAILEWLMGLSCLILRW